MRFLECYFEGAKAGKIHARSSLPKRRADGLGTSLPGRLERRHAALLDVTHSRWIQAAKAPGRTHHTKRLLFPPASYSRIVDSASHPSPRRRIKLSDPSQPSVDKQNSQARPCAAPAAPFATANNQSPMGFVGVGFNDVPENRGSIPYVVRECRCGGVALAFQQTPHPGHP